MQWARGGSAWNARPPHLIATLVKKVESDAYSGAASFQRKFAPLMVVKKQPAVGDSARVMRIAFIVMVTL
jgi:hypothetical protein